MIEELTERERELNNLSYISRDELRTTLTTPNGIATRVDRIGRTGIANTRFTTLPRGQSVDS